jgi:uncharacterized membrane protein YgcG
MGNSAMAGLFRILGVCAVLLVLAVPALAEERIISFDSDVTVAADGELTVIETIKVRAEGYDIKRGIYRDFPTVYEERDGGTHIVGFKVVEVLLDGKGENWFTKNQSNGIRVYIGEKDYYLPKGEYTYRLTYKTDRQIAFHEDFDELYWNVTGNGWAFPIDYARATVHLPEGATVVRKAAYTGPQGAKGTAWSYGTDGNGNPMFATTSRLRANEGLTVAVAFPKGVVAQPSTSDELLWRLRAYAGYVTAGLIWLFILAVYFFIWRRVGRDPEKGTIVPRWRPPAEISPAGARFVTEMGFDSKAIGAAIVSLAVKGKLIIEDDGDDEYKLRRNDKGFGVKLSPGEKAMERALFMWGDSADISDGNHERLKPAVDALKEALSANFEGAHFRRNIGWFALGVALSFVSLIFMGPAMAMPPVQKVPIPLFVVIGGLILINWMFFKLLRAPTVVGRAIMDEVEGFKMYLATAEQNRLNLLHPPEHTPELFEKYLPYAMALDVENEWGDQFTDVFAAAATGGEDGGYHPYWYHSHHGRQRWATAGGFANNLGRSLGSSISSAATPPSSSSSGSGGGGSSGGGGGGGGGGGW